MTEIQALADDLDRWAFDFRDGDADTLHKAATALRDGESEIGKAIEVNDQIQEWINAHPGAVPKELDDLLALLDLVLNGP